MKILIAALLSTFAFNSFAFTSIELKEDVVIQREDRDYLLGFANAGKGSDYCQVSIVSSDDREDTRVIPAGTVLQFESMFQNDCGRDWGRVCRLDAKFSAVTENGSVLLDLTCKDKGLLARPLTVKKINSIAGKILSIE